MGLPLFVAPVESDLPGSKALRRSGVTSPRRSGIRRSSRHSPSRNEQTPSDLVPHESLRSRRRTYTARRGSRRPLPRAFIEALDSGASPERALATAYIRTGYMPPGYDASSTEDREAFTELMRSRFGDNWYQMDWPTVNGSGNASWWDSAPEDPTGGQTSAITAREPLSSVAREARTAETETRDPSLPSSWRWENNEWELIQAPRDSSIAQQDFLRRLEVQRATRHARMRARVRNESYDGLGDRNRSLSPEVWDTLLTTLTPDPQPPSAGSSFASTVASQSAGASASTSRTSLTQDASGSQENQQLSGCENSDDDEIERLRRRHPRYRMLDRSNPRRRDPPLRPPPGYSPPLRPHNRITRRTHMRSPPRTLSPGTLTQNPWLTQVSVGASDEDRAGDPVRQQPDSASRRHDSLPEDDDWQEMQSIVFNLSHREEIPDEWWAQAGVSRTLPREARNQNDV